MRYPFIILIFALVQVDPAKAGYKDSLIKLIKNDFAVYYSPGHYERAEAIAARFEKAFSFHRELLGFKPEVTLLILSSSDWATHTSKDVVYGMPHFNEKNKTLFVAAEDNPYWKSFLPPIDQLPEQLRKPIQSTYSLEDGNLSMQAFFDLLAIHELGHAFHMQGGLTMQRKWMGELFVNIFLHTYIAESEPKLLPALTLFPRMVVAGGVKDYKYTSLKDLEELYDEIAQQHPRNYGWYQCRWHGAAAVIYGTGGKQLLTVLWDALKNKKEILGDEELANFLRSKTGNSIVDMMVYWDRDIIR